MYRDLRHLSAPGVGVVYFIEAPDLRSDKLSIS
jgi:hypothetical protein